MSELSNGDVELKDLLIQSLTANGILTRLQAQLRAAVFLALEKHNYHESMPAANSALKLLQNNTDGLVLFSLVADFLKRAGLDNTLEVFMHEASLNNTSLITPDDLHARLGLAPKGNASVLAAMLNSCLNSSSKVFAERASHVDSANKPNGLAALSDGSHSSTAEGNRALHSDAVHELDSDPQSEPDSDKTSDSQHSLRSGRGVTPELVTSSPNQPVDHSLLAADSRLASNNRDYQDDFDSAVSPAAQILSSASKPDSGVDDNGDRNSKTLENKQSPNLGTTRTTTPGPRASPKFEELSSRPTSRDGLTSTVRIYARTNRRTPTDEDKSDIDEEDDNEEIPEILKDYSVGGDSIDQTIDSDDSLGLDHVEEVRSTTIRSKHFTPSGS